MRSVQGFPLGSLIAGSGLYLSVVNPFANALLVIFPDADLQLLHVVAVRDAHDVRAHEALQSRPHARLAEPVTQH